MVRGGQVLVVSESAPARFIDGLDVGCERKTGLKVDLKVNLVVIIVVFVVIIRRIEMTLEEEQDGSEVRIRNLVLVEFMIPLK